MNDWKVWCQNTSEYEEVQNLLTDYLDKLINAYYSDAGDYVQEKFVKSFAEPIGLLERNLQYKLGIHHSQLEKKSFILSNREKERFYTCIEQVKKMLQSEIKRQYRHYCIFLDAMAANKK